RGPTPPPAWAPAPTPLPMLPTAGLGIAFHAKPKVKQTAGQSLSTIGIDGILYFLGFKDSFISDSPKSAE
ncbi:MAG: hypothetical protein K2F79_04210, partial [Muribaculaceae bacterium]|nr:hypothetical protein [Muribaculaceae bacterium]